MKKNAADIYSLSSIHYNHMQPSKSHVKIKMLNIQTIINLIKQKYSFETFIITYNACKNLIYIICLSYKRFYFASRRYFSRRISQSSFCTDMYRDSAESDKWNPPWNMLVGSTYLPSQITFIKYQIQSLLQLYAMFSYTLTLTITAS